MTFQYNANSGSLQEGNFEVWFWPSLGSLLANLRIHPIYENMLDKDQSSWPGIYYCAACWLWNRNCKHSNMCLSRQGEITHFLSRFNGNFRFPNIDSNYPTIPSIDWHGPWTIKGEKRIQRWIWERNTVWTGTVEISKIYRVYSLIPKQTKCLLCIRRHAKCGGIHPWTNQQTLSVEAIVNLGSWV